jgi:diguanylate cyclase (GGDEF)-like protein
MGSDPARQRTRTFSLRLLVWSFLATHVPLLTVAVYAVVEPEVDRVLVLVLLLVATLIGTGLLLVVLDRELQPIEVATRRLHRFLGHGDLETGGPYPRGELGSVLRDVDATCARLDDSRRAFEDLVNEDVVTGALSRRAGTTALEAALHAASASGDQAVAVALVDVDGFKAVNDELGHATGDLVLRSIAAVLRESPGVRSLSRWGGDEFLVLVDPRDAAGCLDRARTAVADRLRAEVPCEVTLSAGLAMAEAGEGVDAVVGRADAALYAAKAAGRNRVVAAAP